MTISSWAGIVKRTGQRFLDRDPFQMGAALAYYTVFSLAPLVLIAIAIAGLVFGQQAAEGQIAKEIQTAVGKTVAEAIQTMLQSAKEGGRSATASIIGAIVLFIGASGVFVQLQSSLNAIWDVPTEKSGGIWGFIRSRLLSFAMVLGIGFLLLVSLIVTTAFSVMAAHFAPGEVTLYRFITHVLSFLLITLLFALIFKYLPECTVRWGDVWIGAAVTALLFVLGKYLIELYLTAGGAVSAYGAAGSLVIIILWVYYASQILLFGAQFTQVFAAQRQASASLVQSTH